jgi:hypothetical protein
MGSPLAFFGPYLYFALLRLTEGAAANRAPVAGGIVTL